MRVRSDQSPLRPPLPQEDRRLKALMKVLTNASDESGRNIRAMMEAKRFAFVQTDIQDSVDISSQDALAFGQLQEVHDDVVRQF